MTQSKQEADKLMEEQRLGGPQPSDIDDDFDEDLDGEYDFEDEEEQFCYYCGAPIEDGMCSAECIEKCR